MIMCEELYLCGKVIAELELLEEGGHEDGGKEKNDTPEEDIRDVGSMRTAGAAHKLPSLFNTVLQQQIEEARATYTHHKMSNTQESADSRLQQICFIMSINVHRKLN